MGTEIETYYVTFGVQYTKDPERGEQHPMGMHKDGYATIEAPDHATAQKMADAIFATRYSFVYSKADFIDDGTKDRWYSAADAHLLAILWVNPVTGVPAS